jgi:hypothetical protein
MLSLWLIPAWMGTLALLLGAMPPAFVKPIAD